MLVVPFGRRRLLGVVVDLADESELPPERLAEPIAALEADVPAVAGARSGSGSRGSTSPRRRAGSRWCCRRAPAREPAGRCARSARCAPRSPGREAALSREARGLGARQQAALEALASGAAWRCRLGSRAPAATHATLRSLERRGLVRLENAADAPRRPRLERVGARARDVALTDGPEGGVRADRVAPRAGGGRAGRGSPAAPSRGHGQRQDRGLPALGGGRARARPLGDRARARDRAHAADGRPLRRALRRPGGGDALAALAARALRRVVADAPRRGARVRGPALGGVRAVRRPRPDRRRRGARRLVQAGGRPALRRARRRRAPRRRGGRPAAGRQRHAAAGEHACATSGSCCRRASTGGGCRRWSSWGWRAPPARSTSAPARRSTRSAAARRRRSSC